jgi:ATP-dependent DNA helicase PIF1
MVRLDQLTPEQAAVHTVASEGKSLFCMGSAGTGKSSTLRQVIAALRHKAERAGSVYVTASTGIAAINIGGSTIHAALSLGLGQGSPEELVARMNPRRRTEIGRKLRVLIIDECSMVSAAFFETVDRVLRIVKSIDLPFGGIQVILFGDFHQLPPVFSGGSDGRLLFESPIFQAMTAGRMFELTTIFRQKDNRLLELLQDARRGSLTDRSRDILAGLRREVSGETEPLHLFCHNANVDALNAASLAKLPGEAYTYMAEDSGHPSSIEKLNRDTLIPAILNIKVGALVMLLVNVPESSLGNGSRGIVLEANPYDVLVDFGSKRYSVGRSIIRLNDAAGAELASRSQIPLKLSWAATIHKSQGQAIKHLRVDLSGTFAPGQGYVALSRATDIETLQVTGVTEASFWVDPRVKAFSEQAREEARA